LTSRRWSWREVSRSTRAQRRRALAAAAGALWAAHSLCRRLSTLGLILWRSLAWALFLQSLVRWCLRAAWGTRGLSAHVRCGVWGWSAYVYHLIQAIQNVLQRLRPLGAAGNCQLHVVALSTIALTSPASHRRRPFAVLRALWASAWDLQCTGIAENDAMCLPEEVMLRRSVQSCVGRAAWMTVIGWWS
jgi:hypothetical protein